MNAVDKTATPSLDGGNPFRNLKSADLKRDDTSRTTSINSIVVTTISGRVVYKPKPK